MSDDILEHYGKKGMKWGVRKGRDAAAVGGSRASTMARVLKTKVSSLNTPQNKKRMNDGRKLVTQMLKNAGKQKAQALITKGVSDVVDVGIAKAKTGR